MLGGNTGVTSANFIGPKDAGVSLIFKTKANTTSSVTEKMRLTAAGSLGIGTTSPVAKVDVVTSATTAVQGTTKSTTTDARGVVGTASAGAGVEGKSTTGAGVLASSTGGYGVRGVLNECYGVRRPHR